MLLPVINSESTPVLPHNPFACRITSGTGLIAEAIAHSSAGMVAVHHDGCRNGIIGNVTRIRQDGGARLMEIRGAGKVTVQRRFFNAEYEVDFVEVSTLDLDTQTASQLLLHFFSWFEPYCVSLISASDAIGAAALGLRSRGTTIDVFHRLASLLITATEHRRAFLDLKTLDDEISYLQYIIRTIHLTGYFSGEEYRFFGLGEGH